ncbi:hypothetical protein EYF80_063677 [Liparis tanakae]|uniref:Uncharacterized protein n=1 Tax=Liparis tanakae TaxID=230148 RepID=A0A4Z2EBC9_9TELE|nr:hypothetical protein EYF80_063677 [Liparis tanakae]
MKRGKREEERSSLDEEKREEETQMGEGRETMKHRVDDPPQRCSALGSQMCSVSTKQTTTFDNGERLSRLEAGGLLP